jgi:hypothetical protein
MRFRNSIGTTALAAALLAMLGTAALAQTKYPDLKGVWRRTSNAGQLAGGAGGLRWDDSKPPTNTTSLGQEPPLTPEYQAIYNANLADMEKGGQGIDPTFACVNPGMPRFMIGYSPMEFVVTPDVTYILTERDHDHFRHIFTDGRNYPANMADNPQFLGYSIGKWTDEDGDGVYDTLTVETRGMKGPRVFDATGIPLHADNETVIQERIHLDNADLLRDDVTTIDHALTRPWTVTKAFRRLKSDKPLWPAQGVCGEGNLHVDIGNQVYYLGANRVLMPAMKDQPPPDLRYFKSSNR